MSVIEEVAFFEISSHSVAFGWSLFILAMQQGALFSSNEATVLETSLHNQNEVFSIAAGKQELSQFKL